MVCAVEGQDEQVLENQGGRRRAAVVVAGHVVALPDVAIGQIEKVLADELREKGYAIVAPDYTLGEKGKSPHGTRTVFTKTRSGWASGEAIHYGG